MNQNDPNDEVDDIRSNTVAQSSKNVYRSSNIKFINWMCTNYPDVLNATLCAQLLAEDQEETPNKVITRWLANPASEPPLKFADLTVRQFMLYIVSLKKRDGTKPAFTTYATERTALFNLFRDYKTTMSKDFETELGNHFKGLKRKKTQEIANGTADIKVGKDPLSLSLYKYFAKTLMKSAKKDSIFAHTFLLITWNLMCRAGNAVSVCHSHMTWREDALGVYFSHMKNDQSGERPRDPRHIYANPLMPEICPITSLGSRASHIRHILAGVYILRQ